MIDGWSTLRSDFDDEAAVLARLDARRALLGDRHLAGVGVDEAPFEAVESEAEAEVLGHQRVRGVVGVGDGRGRHTGRLPIDAVTRRPKLYA